MTVSGIRREGEGEAAGDGVAGEERRCIVYDERCEWFGRQRDRHAARSRTLGNLRLVAFVGAVALLLWAELSPPGERLLPFLAAVVLLVTFGVLLIRHQRTEERRRWFAELWAVNDEGRHRIRRDWDGVPLQRLDDPPADHPYAHDLDLFGRASVAQLLGPVGTASGRATLRDWLLEPAPPAEVQARQAAVRELAGMADLRDEIAVHARLTREAGPRDIERFLAWAQEEPWLSRRRGLLWTARLIPLATAALAAAHALGRAPALWLIPVIAGIMLSRWFGFRLYKTFDRAFPRQRVFDRYSSLFRLLGEASVGAPWLRRIQDRLGARDVSAHERMHRLERLMQVADVRHSQLLHFPLQVLTLWDFHVLHRLERWQRSAGDEVAGWFDALGEAEALAALAALAHDHPRWAMPDVGPPESPRVSAVRMGHPLLRGSVRVHNDVSVGPPGTYLLVTGSNMSGKSTLLRAIGVNVVLAQAGGPVCATSLRVPPVVLFTSMRVRDSLQEGVSHFMAGLNRLKAVVDTAMAVRSASDRTLLYLLDEILQGTNTAERLTASRRIIRHLVAEGAIGAVTTHDLALAGADELADACQPVHFRETIRQDDGAMLMTFDYRLRPGVATSTNALRLMELVGLAPADQP